MDEIEVGGLRIAYERAGRGPAVVLLQGFVGDGRSSWSEQIDALSDEFTVIAWDAPGAGRSSDPPDSFRIADFADCLVAFLRGLGVPQGHLVGLSFGGIVALAVADRHPEVARSLGLVSAYAGWRGSLPDEDVDDRLRRCLHLSEQPPDDFVRAMVPSMFSAAAPDSVVEAFAASVREFRPAGFRTMAKASAEADLRHVLPEVTVPTLLLYGDHDVRAPLQVAEGLRAGIPSSRLVVLPNVGHVCSVEAPDEVNRALGDFLRSVPSA
ncbi:MAG TPA: alpha/beta hydrolase [Nocardioides sp.]|nr:alpha/beta hydrolase [Nocardioides sp.]